MLSARARLLVLAVALAAAAPSLRNGFVYDDVPAVQEDPRIRSLDSIPRLMVSTYWGPEIRDRIYRPFTTVSFAVDWAVGRGSPLAFHATNVLLHLAVVALVLALAARILTPAGAVVAALWFAVQPVHVEAFANVVGRSELLAAAGYLGAVLAWLAEDDATRIKPRGTRRALLALAVLASSALAFGAKEHAITLPAALVVADLFQARAPGEPPARRLRRRAVLWLGVVAVAAGYVAFRTEVVGSLFNAGNIAAGLQDLNLPQRAFVMLPAYAMWTFLMVAPVRLSVDYSPNRYLPTTDLTVLHLLGALAVAGTLVAAWAARRRAPGITFGIAWFAVAASVVANVALPTGVLVAERVLYLPSVGAALVIAAAWERLPGGRATWAVTALALSLLAIRTVTRIPVWRDNERFYLALVRDAPSSYRTWWARGARAFERSDARTGEQAYLAAIRIYPGDGVLLQELGERYLTAGLWEPADRFLTVAYRVDTLRSDAALQAVLARLRLGRPDSAVAIGEEALRRSPAVPTLLVATGDAYRALGRPFWALALQRRAAFAAPRAWQYQHIAANGAALAGRCAEARLRAARAAALAPPGELAPRALAARLTDGPTCGVAPS